MRSGEDKRSDIKRRREDDTKYHEENPAGKRHREEDLPREEKRSDLVRGEARGRGRGPPPKRKGPPLGDRPKVDTSWRDEQYIKEKLSQIKEPVIDLPPLNFKEVKFQSRNRLYISHISNDFTKEDLIELLKPFGEVEDGFVHRDKFAFARMDYFHNAMKAKHMLDGSIVKGKHIMVRISPQSSIKVKNLPPYVSNELLYLAFSVFGEIDYCCVLADSRGHSLDKGIVDFKYKKSVVLAKKYCNEHFYLLTSYLKPVYVEENDLPYDNDGVPEDQMKKPPAFQKAREKGPRFAVPGSFEFKYAEKYKMLFEEAKAKRIEIKVHAQEAERELEAEVEEAEFDYETEKLKEILIQREMQREKYRTVMKKGMPDFDERLASGHAGSDRGYGGPDQNSISSNEFQNRPGFLKLWTLEEMADYVAKHQSLKDWDESLRRNLVSLRPLDIPPEEQYRFCFHTSWGTSFWITLPKVSDVGKFIRADSSEALSMGNITFEEPAEIGLANKREFMCFSKNANFTRERSNGEYPFNRSQTNIRGTFNSNKETLNSNAKSVASSSKILSYTSALEALGWTVVKIGDYLCQNPNQENWDENFKKALAVIRPQDLPENEKYRFRFPSSSGRVIHLNIPPSSELLGTSGTQACEESNIKEHEIVISD